MAKPRNFIAKRGVRSRLYPCAHPKFSMRDGLSKKQADPQSILLLVEVFSALTLFADVDLFAQIFADFKKG